MFTIDLLKGQGVPIRRGPEATVFTAVTVAVPAVIVIAMIGYYLHTGVVASIEKRNVATYKAKVAKLADAVEFKRNIEAQKGGINAGLAEVASSLPKYTQWSSILQALVQYMPESMILTELEAKYNSVKKQIPKKDDPKTMVEKSIPRTVLTISVSGDPKSNCDKAVSDFRDSLRTSDVLGPKLDDIKVSRGVNKIDSKEFVSFNIDCFFKPVF